MWCTHPRALPRTPHVSRTENRRHFDPPWLTALGARSAPPLFQLPPRFERGVSGQGGVLASEASLPQSMDPPCRPLTQRDHLEETLRLCCLSDLDPPLRARPSPRGAAVLGRSFVTMTRTARLRCVATPSRPGTVGKECTQYRITLPPGRGGVWHSPFVPVAAYSLAAQLKLVHLLFLAESDSISSAYACGLALGARAAGELEGP